MIKYCLSSVLFPIIKYIFQHLQIQTSQQLNFFSATNQISFPGSGTFFKLFWLQCCNEAFRAKDFSILPPLIVNRSEWPFLLPVHGDPRQKWDEEILSHHWPITSMRHRNVCYSEPPALFPHYWRGWNVYEVQNTSINININISIGMCICLDLRQHSHLRQEQLSLFPNYQVGQGQRRWEYKSAVHRGRVSQVYTSLA